MNRGLNEINEAKFRDKLNFLKAAKKANASQPKQLLSSGKNTQAVLFTTNKLIPLFTWADSAPRIGGGLINLGNSCFMNSSLQCIIYSAPFFNFCKQREHSKSCKNRSPFCSFCEMEKLVNIATKTASNSAFRPKAIFGNLRKLSSTLRPGRQEDAHEFIRVLLDSLHNVCCAPFKQRIKHSAKAAKTPSEELQYTSVIHRMWGGFLRSQVHCQACGRDSNTDDPMLGITLATQSSLRKAFKKYTAKEHLTGREKYFCEHCKKKQDAYKRMLILKPPPVLAVHLKRFEFSKSGNRIKKSQHVEFEETLDIGPFVCGPRSQVQYELFAVLVHSGNSAYGGHYYSFVRAPGNESKRWYCMNDSSVSPVNIAKVLRTQAYILMYQMTPSTLKAQFKSTIVEKKSTLIKQVKATPQHPKISAVTSYDRELANDVKPRRKSDLYTRDRDVSSQLNDLYGSRDVSPQLKTSDLYASRDVNSLSKKSELYASRNVNSLPKKSELYASRDVNSLPKKSELYASRDRMKYSSDVYRTNWKKAENDRIFDLGSSVSDRSSSRSNGSSRKYEVSSVRARDGRAAKTKPERLDLSGVRTRTRGELSDRSSASSRRAGSEIMKSDYLRTFGSIYQPARASPTRIRTEASKPPTYRPDREKFDTNSILSRYNLDDGARRKTRHVAPQISLDPPKYSNSSFASARHSSFDSETVARSRNREPSSGRPKYSQVSTRPKSQSVPEVSKTTEVWKDYLHKSKESNPPSHFTTDLEGLPKTRSSAPLPSYSRPAGISHVRRNYDRESYRAYRSVRT